MTRFLRLIAAAVIIIGTGIAAISLLGVGLLLILGNAEREVVQTSAWFDSALTAVLLAGIVWLLAERSNAKAPEGTVSNVTGGRRAISLEDE